MASTGSREYGLCKLSWWVQTDNRFQCSCSSRILRTLVCCLPTDVSKAHADCREQQRHQICSGEASSQLSPAFVFDCYHVQYGYCLNCCEMLNKCSPLAIFVPRLAGHKTERALSLIYVCSQSVCPFCKALNVQTPRFMPLHILLVMQGVWQNSTKSNKRI